jgi:carboxylesterase
VARLVLLAPCLAIRYAGLLPLEPSRYLGYLARLFPNLPRRPPAVRDPEMRRRAAAAEHFRTFSMGATVSALELIDVVKTLVPTITLPTLIIQGTRDTVVEPALAGWLHAKLGSSQKTLVKLPRSDHLVALDHERALVVELVRRFVLHGDNGSP